MGASLWENCVGDFFWSFCIEFSQYFIGASADIDDIILNLLGGILGYAVFAFLSLCFQRTSGWEKLLGNENNRQKKNSIQTMDAKQRSIK